MPATPPDEPRLSARVDALRRELDALVEHDKRNTQERATRFAKIERQVSELEEALRQIQSRLDRLEGKNQP
jgi:predicted  nucleic acid-binding Zn-ribbon protein